MKQVFVFRYSEKDEKNLNHHMMKPSFVSFVVSIGIALLGVLVTLIFTLFSTQREDNVMKTFWIHYRIPVQVIFFSLFLVFLVLGVILTLLSQNYNESAVRKEADQKVILDGHNVYQQVSYGEDILEDRFYAKRIKKTKRFLLIYKNFHSYIAIPVDIVNQEKKEEDRI